MIITIDGPAGSGKSSAARGLAERLGFEVLDTGAMYRAVALAVVRSRIDEANADELAGVLANCQIELPPGRVFLNGADVTRDIRAPDISEAASRLGAVPAVRAVLARLQREIGQGRNMVAEGRDQGTVVFPDAACKFFFQADRVERARRRWQELAQRGVAVTLDDVLADQDVRDRRDASRDAAPMVPAPDAIIIDTTLLTPAQVLDRLEQEVRRCWPS